MSECSPFDAGFDGKFVDVTVDGYTIEKYVERITFQHNCAQQNEVLLHFRDGSEVILRGLKVVDVLARLNDIEISNGDTDG